MVLCYVKWGGSLSVDQEGTTLTESYEKGRFFDCMTIDTRSRLSGLLFHHSTSESV